MADTSRRSGDIIRVALTATLIMAAAAGARAAQVNHDVQRVVLGDNASAPHDRAPCPSETVPG